MKKAKKRKPTKKERELQAEYDKMVAKHSKPLERGAKAKSVSRKTPPKSKRPSLKVPDDRSSRHIASLDSGYGSTAAPKEKKYTGDKIVGLATMHKSNTVPIFNEDAAKDVAKMRR